MSTPNKISARQSISTDVLSKIALATGTTVADLLKSINSEVSPPFNLSATSTPDLNVAIGPSRVVNPITSRTHTVTPLGTDVPNIASGNILFPSSSGGTVTITGGNNTTVTVGSGLWIKGTVYLDTAGSFNILFGSTGATELLATTAAAPSGTLPIGYISLQNSGGVIQNITNAMIYQFSGASSGSSGSGSGLGTDLASIQYNSEVDEPMTDNPSTSATTSSIDVGSNKTDPTLYSVANKYVRLNYDGSKTVTGSTTNMTLSGTPAFTVKIGDMLIVNGQARRITTVTSQTVYVIEAAFTNTPSPSATQATVSQCVYSKDLNNFAFDGVAQSSVYTDSISSVLVAYNDTSSVGSTTYNYTDPALVAFSASSDGTSYSDVKVRESNPSLTAPVTNLPTTSTSLYLRFFSNATSGSGAVNLTAYHASFHKQTFVEGGGIQGQAYGFCSVATAQLNSTASVVNSKTRITFSGFSYAVGVNPGLPNGQLTVRLNGQKIPRFVDSTNTPGTPSSYYTEVSPTIIDLDRDYSGVSITYEAMVTVSVVDTNTSNTTLLAKVPTVQKFLSGSGTYTTPAGCLWMRVRMVGGGGGGAGSGTSGGTNGNVATASTASTFGTSLLSAGGGSGGSGAGGNGGAGGTSSLGTGPIGTALTGGSGSGVGLSQGINFELGGSGASSAFGGAGGGGSSNQTGQAGAANTGGGGGGGAMGAAIGTPGAGGGSGGFVDAIITSPLSSYAYTVGVGGSGGASGTSGNVGGAGGSGYIIVEEFYK